MSRNKSVVTPHGAPRPPQSPISAHPALGPMIKRAVNHAATTAPPARSKSYAELLDRLYRDWETLADEIATSSESPIKRATALKELSKALPMLQAAEQNAKLSVRNKDISQLTDAELDRLVTKGRKALSSPTSGSTPDSPTDLKAVPVMPTRAQKKENPIGDVGEGKSEEPEEF